MLGGIPVLAESSIDISHPYIDVKLHGYIDFVEGPLWITDKIWYNGLLYGTDIDIMVSRSADTKATLIPGTDKSSKQKITLHQGKRTASGDKVSCGRGGSYGKLKMNCGGKTKTITS